jgi:hypothetical protein
MGTESGPGCMTAFGRSDVTEDITVIWMDGVEDGTVSERVGLLLISEFAGCHRHLHVWINCKPDVTTLLHHAVGFDLLGPCTIVVGTQHFSRREEMHDLMCD